MAIGNKRYSHLMPRHKRQAGKILERDIHYVVPQPNYWGNMSPVPQFRRLYVAESAGQRAGGLSRLSAVSAACNWEIIRVGCTTAV